MRSAISRECVMNFPARACYERAMKFPIACSFASVLFVATAAAQYTTGFENPPFASGNIHLQDAWSGNSAAARIRTAAEIASDLTTLGLNPANPVHGGSQAFLVSATNVAGSTTLRPVSGLQSELNVLLEVWARPLGAPAANMGNVFLVMEDNASTPIRGAAFRFGSPVGEGGVLKIDYATSSEANVFSWQSSGVLWNTDSWYHFAMDVNYATKTYDFFIDGNQINVDPIPFYNRNSANFSQIRVFRGGNQVGMILDDLSVTVVPEPTTVALLLTGLGALLWRRKCSRA